MATHFLPLPRSRTTERPETAGVSVPDTEAFSPRLTARFARRRPIRPATTTPRSRLVRPPVLPTVSRDAGFGTVTGGRPAPDLRPRGGAARAELQLHLTLLPCGTAAEDERLPKRERAVGDG